MPDMHVRTGSGRVVPADWEDRLQVGGSHEVESCVDVGGGGPAGHGEPAGRVNPGDGGRGGDAAQPYSCAANGPAGSQTVYGTFGDASVLGWAGNNQAVVACLGGSFFVISGGQPGSGSATPVTGTTYGYGIYNDTRTTWANADGYLPALVTTFQSGGATVQITNFGDQVTVGGHPYVAIYSRVRVTNPTGQPLTIDPQPQPA